MTGHAIARYMIRFTEILAEFGRVISTALNTPVSELLGNIIGDNALGQVLQAVLDWVLSFTLYYDGESLVPIGQTTVIELMFTVGLYAYIGFVLVKFLLQLKS